MLLSCRRAFFNGVDVLPKLASSVLDEVPSKCLRCCLPGGGAPKCSQCRTIALCVEWSLREGVSVLGRGFVPAPLMPLLPLPATWQMGVIGKEEEANQRPPRRVDKLWRGGFPVVEYEALEDLKVHADARAHPQSFARE